MSKGLQKDLLNEAIPRIDLPGYLETHFPESGAKAGKPGTYRAVWRGDRHPSLSVSLKNGVWLFHDKVTGDSGNIFHLVTLAEGKNNAEAAERVKQLAGLPSPSRATFGAQPQIVATYPYTDESGVELFQTVRLEPGFGGKPKTFYQRRRAIPGNEHAPWLRGLGAGWYKPHGDEFKRLDTPNGRDTPPEFGAQWFPEVRRVLYRLPAIVNAALEEQVFVVEGEKDADTMHARGFVATCNAMGAGKWRDEYTSSLVERHVVLVGDNDQAGRDHMRQVALALHGRAASVKLVELPGLPPKGDVSDWFAAGGTTEQLRRLVTETPEWHPDAPNEASSTEADVEEENDTRGKSQAAILVELAAGVELYRTPDDEIFADVRINDRRETLSLNGKRSPFRDWLSMQAYRATGKVPSSQALSDALAVLQGRARFEGAVCPVFVRLAHHDSSIYLDLGTEDRSAVRITAEGWCMVSDPPVRFRRTRGMLALPTPVRGGRLDELLTVVNIRREDWPLVAGYLIMCFHPFGPYPILLLLGEQGTGKTSTAEKIRAIIDPAVPALRAEPKELRDLMVGAINNWLLPFDNLSHITPWLSDGLCRISTGGGFAIRAHYENAEEALFQATRPVLINGIDDVVTRSDLLDRCVTVETQFITDSRRRTKAEIERQFTEMQPRVLGALLDAVVMAMRHHETVQLPGLPRMADFAKWVVAAEPALGLREGEFMAAYAGNRAGAHDLILDNSPVAAAIRELFARNDGYWRGTPAELHRELAQFVDDAGRRTYPRTAKSLKDAIYRVKPNLRAVGIEAEHFRSNGKNQWAIKKAEAGSTLPTLTVTPTLFEPPIVPASAPAGPVSIPPIRPHQECRIEGADTTQVSIAFSTHGASDTSGSASQRASNPASVESVDPGADFLGTEDREDEVL